MNAKEFKRVLLSEMLSRVKSNEPISFNFDFLRFNPDDEVALNGFYNSSMNYIIENIESFYRLWLQLKDSASRTIYVNLLIHRMIGYKYAKIFDDLDFDLIMNKINDINSHRKSKSELCFSNEKFGDISHFEGIDFCGTKINMDCWAGNLLPFYSRHLMQYFYETKSISVKPMPNDVVFDLGGCMGETAVMFSLAVGDNGKVYSFDPLIDHVKAIEFNARQNNITNIHAVQFAVSEHTNIKSDYPYRSTGILPGFSLLNGDHLPTITLDDYVSENNIQKLDFIKMDIEGVELKALKGAENTIVKFRPKLAICIYHKQEDFVEIPEYIAAKYPFYDFYLNHHSIHHEETVLYCYPSERADIGSERLFN